MSLLNRLTPGKFNPLRKLNLESLHPRGPSTFRSHVYGRSLQRRRPHSLREGTNQQIRVLNLNRRPNINSRPRSARLCLRTFVRCSSVRLSVPRTRFSWSRSLVPHRFCHTASAVPTPPTCLICGTAWRLSDIYERRSEKRNSERLTRSPRSYISRISLRPDWYKLARRRIIARANTI